MFDFLYDASMQSTPNLHETGTNALFKSTPLSTLLGNLFFFLIVVILVETNTDLIDRRIFLVLLIISFNDKKVSSYLCPRTYIFKDGHFTERTFFYVIIFNKGRIIV